MEIAWILPLVLVLDGRVLEIAGGIAVAILADELQKRIISRTPLETERFAKRLGGAIGLTGDAAIGIGDAAPGLEYIRLLFGGENAIPFNGATQALLKTIGEEAVVESGGVEPDLAAGALGGSEGHHFLRVAFAQSRLRTRRHDHQKQANKPGYRRRKHGSVRP